MRDGTGRAGGLRCLDTRGERPALGIDALRDAAGFQPPHPRARTCRRARLWAPIISTGAQGHSPLEARPNTGRVDGVVPPDIAVEPGGAEIAAIFIAEDIDRKSTRLNSSH